MLTWIKAIFTTDTDPQLTKIRKLTAKKVPYSVLNEDEQVFLMLRLANKRLDEIAIALGSTINGTKKLEENTIAKLTKVSN